MTVLSCFLNIEGNWAQGMGIPGTLHSFHMYQGETRRGYVEGGKDDSIRIHVPLHSSSADSVITVLLKRNSIQKVIPLEWNFWEAVMKEENQEVLKNGWNAMNCLLGLPGARVGTLGNALADILIHSNTQKHDDRINKKSNKTVHLSLPSHIPTAHQLYALIEEKSSDLEEKIAARIGRLRTCMREGKNHLVMEETKKWIEDSRDAPLEAYDIYSESSFIEIEKLVQEHPCWKEDRFIQPQMTQLLNICLDASLATFVRHPAHKNLAAEGLLRSIHIYSIIGNTLLEKQTALDVLNYYPQFGKQVEYIINQLEKEKGKIKNDDIHSSLSTVYIRAVHV